jgi:3-dehydroquinate dehydratase/shikimate dehydrogenase
MALLAAVSSNPVPNRVLPEHLPRLCVPVAAAQAGEMIALAERAARSNSFLEFRLDHLSQPAAGLPKLREFLAARPELIALATCRKKQSGGNFRGSVEAECAILAKAAQAGCQWVDLSLESAERAGMAALKQLRARASLMISYHDYGATRHLAAVERRLRSLPADIYKGVWQAKRLEDNVKVLRWGADLPAPRVAFCMGEAGQPSRILALQAGSPFTYAAAMEGAETAEGQFDVAALQRIYRIEEINRATRVYGVTGHPVAHSLSPLMLNTAFRRASVNAVYVPLPARHAEEALALAAELPLGGFSITLPYKTALLRALDGVDALARQVGAINTVVRSAGKFYGYNTDVAGILGPLENRTALERKKVLVLGAGGAARAAVFGLRSRGADVHICNRTPARARQLARAAGAKTILRRELAKTDFDILVHATPVGLFPKVRQSPLATEEIRAGIVFDLVYNPLETELLRRARQRGAQVITGLEMFVAQGAEQFEIWTGKPAPRQEMYHAVLSELQSR